MHFEAPLFLIGLSGAAIPVILHLVRRRTRFVVPFPTLRFLRRSLLRTARRFQVQQKLLLALRVAAISLASFALSRPSFHGGRGAGPVSAVIVLDNSASMGYREEGVSRFDRAKEAALRILDTLERGDSASVTLTNPPASSEKPRLVRDLARARERVAEARLSSGRANIRGAIEAACDFAAGAGGGSPEIHIVTDGHRSNWLAPAGGESAESPSAARLRAGLVSVALLGSEEWENTSVNEVSTSTRPQAVGTSLSAEPRLLHHGAGDRTVSVSLLIDTKKQDERTVTLSPDEPRLLKLDYKVEKAGIHHGEIVLEADRLEMDDRFSFPITAGERIPAACVDAGQARPTGLLPSYHLMVALDPRSSGSQSAILPTRMKPEEIPGANLSRYRVLVLVEVPALSAEAVSKLEEFVREGGGLLVFPGPATRPSEYNQWKFLPASLTDVAGDPTERSWLTFGQLDFEQGPLKSFSSPGSGNLTLARFYEYYDLKTRDGTSGVRVLARLTNGSPAIIEMPYGEGHVILTSFTADTEWTNLPLRPFYLPLIHELVYYLCRWQSQDREIVAGGTAKITFPLDLYRQEVTIRRPSGTEVRAFPKALEASSEMIFSQTDEAGLYVVEGPAAEAASPAGFTVNSDRQESDLTPSSDEDIRSVLAPLAPLITHDLTNLSQTIRKARCGTSLTGLLVCLALTVIVAETVLANRLGARGILARRRM